MSLSMRRILTSELYWLELEMKPGWGPTRADDDGAGAAPASPLAVGASAVEGDMAPVYVKSPKREAVSVSRREANVGVRSRATRLAS